jgi:hypothetical protein
MEVIGATSASLAPAELGQQLALALTDFLDQGGRKGRLQTMHPDPARPGHHLDPAEFQVPESLHRSTSTVWPAMAVC